MNAITAVTARLPFTMPAGITFRQRNNIAKPAAQDLYQGDTIQPNTWHKHLTK